MENFNYNDDPNQSRCSTGSTIGPSRHSKKGTTAAFEAQCMAELEAKSSDIMKKVEDEVVAKLARASLMGALYSAHCSGAETDQTSQAQLSGNSGSMPLPPSPQPMPGNYVQPPNIQDTHNQPCAPMMMPDALWSRNPQNISGTGHSSFVPQVAAAGADLKVDLAQQPPSLEDLWAMAPKNASRVGQRLDQQLVSVLEEFGHMAAAADPDHGYCLPHWGHDYQILKKGVLEAYTSVLLRNTELAHKDRISQRLWMVFYKSIDSILQVLKLAQRHAKARKKALEDSIPDKDAERLRALQDSLKGALFDEMAQAKAHLEGLVQRLQDQMKATHHSLIPPIIQVFVLGLGDLARYKELHQDTRQEKQYHNAEKLYRKAFQIYPEQGKPWNQLAVLATYRRDSFGALYCYLRAMTTKSPFPAKENLLGLFEKCKKETTRVISKHGPSATAMVQLTKRDHKRRFLLHLSVSVGICFSHIDMDSFGPNKALALRHLDSLLRLHFQEQCTPDCPSSRSIQKLVCQSVLVVIAALYCMSPGKRGATNAVKLGETGQMLLGLLFELISLTLEVFKLGRENPEWKVICFVGLAIFWDWSKKNTALLDEDAVFESPHFLKMRGCLVEVLNSLRGADTVNVTESDPAVLETDVETFGCLAVDTQTVKGRGSKIGLKGSLALPELTVRCYKLAEFAIDKLWFYKYPCTGGKHDHIYKLQPLGASKQRGVPIINPEDFPQLLGNQKLEDAEQLGNTAESEPESNTQDLETTQIGSARCLLEQVQNGIREIDLEMFKSLATTEKPSDSTQHILEAVLMLLGYDYASWEEACQKLQDHDIKEQLLKLNPNGVLTSTREKLQSFVSLHHNSFTEDSTEGLGIILAALVKANLMVFDLLNNKSISQSEALVENCNSSPSPAISEGPQEEVPIFNMKSEAEVLNASMISKNGENQAGNNITLNEKSKGILIGVELPKQNISKLRNQVKKPQRRGANFASSSSVSFCGQSKKRPGALSEADIALPLIVLDVPNISMRHGLNKEYSCKGAELAFEFFLVAGHRVVGFIPDYALNPERIGGLERAAKIGIGGVRNSQLPNNVGLLQHLVDQGLIIATPPQDYDDSYCIKYALQHNGYVVTNDMYRDHLEKIQDKRKRAERKAWLKSHLISYTFVGDEFFPNPDFSFS